MNAAAVASLMFVGKGERQKRMSLEIDNGVLRSRSSTVLRADGLCSTTVMFMR